MTKDNGMDVTPSWDELRKSVDILRSMGDALQKERDALDMTRQRLLDERNQALKARDALRREAELHAQETRTQRATVQEIYQLVTGSTGEPGDWNGAEPVRALIEERDALATEAADWEEVAYRFQAERNALVAQLELLREPALSLANTVENRDDLPIHKWALQCARLVPQVRKAAKGTPTTFLARRDAHPDNVAVDRFSLAMKDKLAEARDKGRDGWDDPDRCSVEMLCDLLVEHLEKGNAGNYVDIANMAMMLHLRHASPELLRAEIACLKARWQAEALEVLADELSLNAGNARENGYWMTADAMEDASSEALEASGRIRRQAEEGCS